MTEQDDPPLRRMRDAFNRCLSFARYSNGRNDKRLLSGNLFSAGMGGLSLGILDNSDDVICLGSGDSEQESVAVAGI